MSTVERQSCDLSVRLSANPLITPPDVRPSRPEVEVVSVFNAASAIVGDEVVLLLRVSEQLRSDIVPSTGALTLDLSGPEPWVTPLHPDYYESRLVPVSFFDTRATPPGITDVFLPADLPGIDLSDPRCVSRTRPTLDGRHSTKDDFLTQMSHLRVARSTDGVNFVVDDHPSIQPSSVVDEYGCEDPRITFIDGEWHITYVSVSRIGITTSRATTTDFRTFTFHGVMFLPDNKDVVLFPRLPSGRYAALTRPMPASFGVVHGAWLSLSDDLVHWSEHRPLIMPRVGMWDSVRTGASTVPFRVDGGWVEIYHGVDTMNRYALGAVLLDDSLNVVARSSEPIMSPSAPYEESGFLNNVIFSCGHIPLDERNESIRVYYGAGDCCVAAADFSVNDIINSLTRV
jgi:predicted GH43/DUF377 family glycosyl hydrolase